MQDKRKDASRATKRTLEKVAQSLNFDDTTSFDDALANPVCRWDEVTITNDAGDVVWSLAPYADQTVDAPAPDTVNPSLWRQARLNMINGLYKVEDGFYQVRAYDMSNMTIIEAPEGLIIIDPLISVECAAAALQLYRESTAKGARDPVRGVIYTHSHIDHFGGVAGVVDKASVVAGEVEIVAPNEFLEHAVSENIYAGVAMSRRAKYMYGPLLKQDSKGQVDGGLGKGQSVGTVSLIPPTRVITERRQHMKLAGMEIEFQLTPGAEAPAEMNFFFPEHGILCGAENITHNMHNLQTLRGARVRDPLAWSKYLNEALALFGSETRTMFMQHHWPVWGADNVKKLLRSQRDMFRYFNDQALRMLNRGYTGVELAEVFEMPPEVDKSWSCRGYYGTVSHNAKAVYDRYMGWFNGNPCDLHPLPPAQTAPKYVTLMGGADKVLKAAEVAHGVGDYRWSAELLKHLVFDDQDNTAAKELLADSLEQLGYQAEAATWRNFYLMGAQELRHGIDQSVSAMGSDDAVEAMTTEMLFDAFGARVIGPKAAKHPMVMHWRFTDVPAKPDDWTVEISNGALSHSAGLLGTADVTVTLTRAFLNRILLGQETVRGIIDSDDFTVTGEHGRRTLIRFFTLLDPGDRHFPIVTPRSDAAAAWHGSRGGRSEKQVLDEQCQLLSEMQRGC
ncbi:MAG: alkyl sulfatase dimerization domain-containing protein [Haliangiales bacterium]